MGSFIVYSLYFVLVGGADHGTECVFSKVGGGEGGQEGKGIMRGEPSPWRPPSAKQSQALLDMSTVLLMAGEWVNFANKPRRLLFVSFTSSFL